MTKKKFTKEILIKFINYLKTEKIKVKFAGNSTRILHHIDCNESEENTELFNLLLIYVLRETKEEDLNTKLKILDKKDLDEYTKLLKEEKIIQELKDEMSLKKNYITNIYGDCELVNYKDGFIITIEYLDIENNYQSEKVKSILLTKKELNNLFKLLEEKLQK